VKARELLATGEPGVRLTLYGLGPDGAEHVVDGLRVVKVDAERMILEKPDERHVERYRATRVTTRRKWDMAPITPGTRGRALIRGTIGDTAQDVIVTRGYGRRISVRFATQPEPGDMAVIWGLT
jgi:hypothetical protein